MNALVKQGHLTDLKVYVCPSSTGRAGEGNATVFTFGAPASKTAESSLSYGYVYVGPQYSSASAVSADLNSTNAGTAKANHEDYGNILYADGHVKGYASKEWYTEENTGKIHVAPNKEYKK